ncbi:MAG: cysteine desulfurase-like protein [Actinobacteria bacterium]|nr:cysteine desulfurase-like protein [Actinomycetota bacterium]
MPHTSYDVAALRDHFPSLASGIAHFDGPGGTQTPREVAEAIAATLTAPLSNRGTVGRSERNADAAVAAFRSAYADFLGFPAEGIVYGRSATALTYDLSRAIAKTWGPGDEVVVSRLDHDGNVRPWVQAAESAGATVRWLDIVPETGELDLETLTSAITPATRLVAVTAASNLIGTIPPVRTVADAAHAVGALVYVDAVHFAAHELVDPVALGADLVVCSPYKFLGPHCGVLGADPVLLETFWPDKLLPSTTVVPERYELGTLPYETLAGATAAVDFLASVDILAAVDPAQVDPGEASDRRERLGRSFAAIDAHEGALRARLESGLASLPGVLVHSRAARRTPTLLVSLPGRRCRDAYEFLATRDVLAPAGQFYAYEPYRRLGIDDEGGLRLGLAPYSTEDDVERALAALADFLADEA